MFQRFVLMLYRNYGHKTTKIWKQVQEWTTGKLVSRSKTKFDERGHQVATTFSRTDSFLLSISRYAHSAWISLSHLPSLNLSSLLYLFISPFLQSVSQKQD